MFTMKHIILPLIAAMAVATSASAATALQASQTTTESLSSDTLLIVNRQGSVVITENTGGLKIVSTTTNDDGESETVEYTQPYAPNVTIKSQQRSTTVSSTEKCRTYSIGNDWDIITGGLNIGYVFPEGQPADLGLQWGRSLEISIVNAFAACWRHRSIRLSVGLGFDWRNYKITTSNHYLTPNEVGGVTTAPYPEYANHAASRLKVFSLGIPVLYTQHLPHTSLAVTVGGIVNFNTHASLKTYYNNALGNRVEEYSADVHQRYVTFDLYGAFQIYDGCGFYVRYSPQSVLQGHNSPSFSPLSAGITLFL